METTKPSARVKKHGTWLSIWLWLVLIVNAIGAIANLGGAFSSASPIQGVVTPMWAFLLLGVFSVVNVAAAVALLKWKLWGFYAVVGVSVVAFVINLVIGVGIVTALAGFLGPVILYLLMKPKWNHFEK